MKVFIKEVDQIDSAVPGAVIAIQSFGDFLGHNPHAHVLLTDGCFHDNGMIKVAPHFDAKALEEILRHKVFRLLISKGKITEDMVKLLKSWRHLRFHVYCGDWIQPGDRDAMESLARYIIRACFSQERMTYMPEGSKVVYVSKNGKEKESSKQWNGWRPCAAISLTKVCKGPCFTVTVKFCKDGKENHCGSL